MDVEGGIPWAKTSVGVVHAAAGVGRPTVCGVAGPFAARWRFVDCVECLRKAPDDPRIRARLAEVLAELERRRSGAF